jgi:LmbE family N-acetylglucosaminyl deacetylase
MIWKSAWEAPLPNWLRKEPRLLLIVTDGGRASNPFGWTEQRMAEVRRAEALRAAEVLGVKDVIFCDQPDASDEVDVKAVRRKLVEVLTRLKPTEIYTLHEELDRHTAHRQAGSLVRDSMGESGFTPSGGAWAYEVWGPFARWDRIEYIDAYVEKKRLAIAEHRSQVTVIPYGEGMLGLNRWRAVYADPMEDAPAGTYAEVFSSGLVGSYWNLKFRIGRRARSSASTERTKTSHLLGSASRLVLTFRGASENGESLMAGFVG